MSLLLNSVTSSSQWDIDPTTIQDCAIWFDAADTDTITGTSPVTAWRSKGSLSLTATNDVGTCTSGSGTINGRNYISCPQGTNLAFTTALTTQAKSIFLVVRGHQQLTTQFFAPFTRGTASTTQTAVLFSRASSTSYHYNVGLAAWTTVKVNAQCAYQATPTTLASLRSPVPNFYNTTRVYAFVNSTVANNNCISINGVEYSPSTTPVTLTTTVSASGYDTANIKYLINNSDTSATYNTGMDYCEIIYYGRALSVTERKMLEGYLAWKWGIVTNDNSFTSPLSVPNCLAWYDADVDFNDATSRATSFTFSAGNSVQTWLDKSGNGNTATAATAARGTLTQNLTNGKCGVAFGAGATTSLTSTLSLGTSQSFTVFAVASSVTFLTLRSVLSVNGYPGTTGGYLSLQQSSASPGVWQWTGGTGFAGFTTGVPLGTSRVDVVSAIWSSGSSQYTANGLAQPITSTTPTALTSSAQLIISGLASSTTIGNSWAGNIFEIIVYDGVLSDENRLKVEKYLSLKWNDPYYIGTLAKYHSARLYRPFNRYTNPLDIAPNCALWLDASDPSTITMSGTRVTNIIDKSGGNARYPNVVPSPSATVTTMGTINGIPALSFDGTASMAGDNLGMSGGATATAWFIVANITTTNPARPALLAGDSYGPISGVYANAQNAIYVNANNLELKFRSVSGGTLFTATTPVTAGTPVLIYACTLSPANNQYHIGTNGTKGTVSTTTNFTQDTTSASIRLGSSGNTITAYESRLVGLIGEVIGYNTIMTDNERQRVEGYLAWKWGLQSLLPSTHPYASTKPTINGPKIHPMQIANAMVWLDAMDPDGTEILPASGTPIRQWVDKSGLARTCVQTTAALCPTFVYDGNYPAIQFNGTTQFLQSITPLNSGATVTTYSAFIVYRPTSLSANNVVFFQSLSTLATAEASSVHVRVYATNASNQTYFFTRYSATATKDSATNSATTDRTLASITETGNTTVNVNANDMIFFKNGQSQGANVTGTGNRSATADNGRYIIGAQCFSSTYGNYFAGYVHEVLFFNRQISDMERRYIEGYLAWKWGMNTTMTANQPSYGISL